MMSRELRYGLIAGFITLIWMAIGYWLKWNETETGKYAPLLSLIILVVAIYVTILFKREKDKGGVISFKEAFIAGLSVSFMVGILVGLFLMAYTSYINPGLVDQIIEDTKNYYQQQNASPEEIDKAVKAVRASYSPFGQMTYGIGTTMLIGALVSLICAAIMRRGSELGVGS